jgi:glycosyltransferase involved in cell wall biosynthesis
MKLDTKKNKILYIAPSLSSFVRNDVAVLSKYFHVVTNTYAWNKKYLTPFYLLHQIYFLLKNIRSTKKIIVSFAGYWSFFPALAGKLAKIDVFIILNGTDCASIPPVNYGDLRKSPLKTFIKLTYKMAAMLLPVSASLVFVRNTYYSDDEFSFQGYKHFFPRIKTKSKVVSNGFDENFWRPLKEIDREPKSFLAVFSSSQYILKGGDLIQQLSGRFPECKFYIAGTDKPVFLKEEHENLVFLGKLSAEALRNYYNKSTFYFQLSIFEGFGCALSESMLCGCIPIGSSVNIIPEIIGNSGFILNKKDITELENIIHKVLMIENKNRLAKMAREQIINNYSIKKREQELISLIER